MNHEKIHVPVLLDEILDMLRIRPDGVYLDGTVGLGGHSSEILSRIPEGVLIGIDKDDDALRHAAETLGDKRVFLRKGAFSNISEIVSSLGIKAVDGVLLDLGVSMLQLKAMERGFSFLSQERLDMRMDKTQDLSAWEVVNGYPEADLERVIREYGEEPFARRIVREIVSQRKKARIETCKELADLIARVSRRRGKSHPATLTFQALRIEVNGEMDELRKGLAAALDILSEGGRLCVISYHSLEDRIVKNFMREEARGGLIELITKKPLPPSREEVRRNPASRSAKLRVGEKRGARV
ncbi:MAG: 16S rRNA (cytosine(1402)-N(4))-methyltransferase RsmH [Thermodesulfovibrionales bacterium]|jgi:16S rRNA (cytosine1402-N4)-methyltransferase